MAFQEIDMATVDGSLRSVLVLGVEKSGKTTFIGTAERPILHYCFDASSWMRFAGAPGIKTVVVDGPNAVSDFERDVESLLITPKKYKWPDGREEVYKTIAFDPYSFHSDNVYEEEERRVADSFKLYGNIMKNHKAFLGKVKRLAKTYDVIVTSHVEIKQDDTTGQKMFLADINGKTRNSIGAHFDAVLFTKVIPRGNKADYFACPVPDSARKAGVRVPMGCEDVFGPMEPLDFTAFKRKYSEALAKLRQKPVATPKPNA